MSRHAVTPRRCSDDTGAALIEFALIVPVLATFMLGTLEFGLAWRDKTSVANALRNAARTDSSLSGNRDRLAEYFALDQFRTATANLPRMALQKLIVYKTDATGGFLTGGANCGTTAPTSTGTGVLNHCNIYGPTQLSTMTMANFGTTSTSTDCTTTTLWDYRWCPITRANDITTANGPDYLAIRSVYTYTLITKVLPNSTITMTDTAVIRIEPKVGS